MSAIALLNVFYENKQINILDYNLQSIQKRFEPYEGIPAYEPYHQTDKDIDPGDSLRNLNPERYVIRYTIHHIY